MDACFARRLRSWTCLGGMVKPEARSLFNSLHQSNLTSLQLCCLSPCEAAEKASSCKALQLACLKSKATVSILFYMCGKMSLYHSVRCIWRTGIPWQTGFGRQPKIHIISTIKHKGQEHQVGTDLDLGNVPTEFPQPTFELRIFSNGQKWIKWRNERSRLCDKRSPHRSRRWRGATSSFMRTRRHDTTRTN
jgi:hypothetical protein